MYGLCGVCIVGCIDCVVYGLFGVWTVWCMDCVVYGLCGVWTVWCMGVYMPNMVSSLYFVHITQRLYIYIYIPHALCRTRYVGNCSSVGHDVRFERVVMVRGVYFDHIDVGRQAFS